MVVDYVPSLQEGDMESLSWAEESREPAHLGVVFVVKQCLHFIQEKSTSCVGKHSKTINSYDTWTLNVKTKQGAGVTGHA